VLRALAAKENLPIHVDSCGTHDYHVGQAPDRRSQAHAKKRGYDLSAQRARQISESDFEEFDLLLAMDRGHLEILQRLSPARYRAKLKLFRDFAGLKNAEVPDPYYGIADGFEEVLDMVEAASRGLIEQLRDPVRNHLSRVST
jgi:protein-tyrosine phosphatase